MTETKVKTKKAFVLTVDWCNLGKRGIFCDISGKAFIKNTEHSQTEMHEILGIFAMILSPQSIALSKEEVSHYTQWHPLAEYEHQLGIAIKVEGK